MSSRVFLTGATGNMGRAGLQELLSRGDRFDVVVLSRDSKKNRKFFRKYKDYPQLTIVWGDMERYEDVLKCVEEADYVLHVGGMVSPAADRFPEKTMRVNILSAQNIVKAVKAQPNHDKIGVVYIGSVAQTGEHNPPDHWGECGDLIKGSKLDYYSLSKCVAERVFSESGLKKWVSIRQSGMLYPALLTKGNDPITFHVPFSGVLEWTTVEDSGRLLANVCESWVNDSFWRRFYNLSSGPSYRLTNYEFEQLLLKTISCPPVEKVFERRWFATTNFHGQWYTDSQLLEEQLHFRDNIPSHDYFKKMKKRVPWYFSLAPIVPAAVIKLFMKRIATKDPLGTLYWIKHDVRERIDAHFGSKEEWKKIGSWEEFDRSRPSDTPPLRDKISPNRRADEDFTYSDLVEVAQERGGRCLEDIPPQGGIYSPVRWECGVCGTKFELTPNSVIRGGHWCPKCLEGSVIPRS